MLTHIVAGRVWLGMDATIDILGEREIAGGWQFNVAVRTSAGHAQQCSLKLSFADYNLWSSSGADAPSSVARAVVLFMVQHASGEPWPESFDASLARRKFSDADMVIPTLIQS